jgi:predicted nucleic acid-binding protein
VKFWDASAIVPLLMVQRLTPRLRSLFDNDPVITVWWASEIECVSALSRLEREGFGPTEAITGASKRLEQLARNWHEIDPSETIRETAKRFLRVHSLRAGDALQLAAAYLAADRRPSSLDLVTLDDRLVAAARKEGFAVVDVAAAT